MANLDIEQKILGRLAKQTAASNYSLSSCLYQILGLWVLLSRKLFRARRLRRLDITRDTKSVALYHQIIWLAREGLSITEVYILPYCQDGDQGPACRVMAAKLRASFYHVFCLYHNHPPINQLSPVSGNPPQSSGAGGPLTPRAGNGQSRLSPTGLSQRNGKSALRDTIPSMTSESSYITNPYAQPQSPPPSYPVPPVPTATPPRHRTPTHPPGLNIPPSAQTPTQRSPPSSASYLLPPIDFVPAAHRFFRTASSLAIELLPGSDPLRLSVALEHAAFLWDCAKDEKASRRLARDAIKEVYAAAEGMDDAEYEDAATLVRTLGAIVRRGSQVAEELGAADRGQGGGGVGGSASGSGSGSGTRSAPMSPFHKGRRATTGRGPDKPLPRTPEETSGTEGRSTTLVGSPATAATAVEPRSTEALRPPLPEAGRSRARSKGRHQRRSSERSDRSDKERKRKLVEKAEEEIIRRNSEKSSIAERSRQGTPGKDGKSATGIRNGNRGIGRMR